MIWLISKEIFFVYNTPKLEILNMYCCIGAALYIVRILYRLTVSQTLSPNSLNYSIRKIEAQWKDRRGGERESHFICGLVKVLSQRAPEGTDLFRNETTLLSLNVIRLLFLCLLTFTFGISDNLIWNKSLGIFESIGLWLFPSGKNSDNEVFLEI